jgi:hypothetical protein
MKHLRWCLGGLALVLGASVALAQGGPGYFELPLMNEHDEVIGMAHVYNTPKRFEVHIEPADPWLLSEYQIYAGYDRVDIDPIPTTKKGNVIPGKFPYQQELAVPLPSHEIALALKEQLGFSWGSQYRDLRDLMLLVHGDFVQLDQYGEMIAETGAWMRGGAPFPADAWLFNYRLAHPMRGQFIDSPVQGLTFHGPTQHGVTGLLEDESVPTDQGGGFPFFPGEEIEFSVGTIPLGTAAAEKKVSPLELFEGSDIDDPRVIGVARTLQTLDEDSGADSQDGKIVITTQVATCFSRLASGYLNDDGLIDWGDEALIDELLAEVVSPYTLTDPPTGCNGAGGSSLALVDAAEAQGNLESGLNASGIFRKNVSKTEDFGETKQKLDVMPVYYPGLRSDGSPSICCIDETDDGIDDCDPKVCDDPETPDIVELCAGDPGVPYEEWRLGGDPAAEECDPRLDSDDNGVADGDEGRCVVTLIECRELAKPIVTTYLEKIDIYDDQVTTEFWPGRFSWDVYTAISRDDGTTWKRMNVSRMADMSSFELETGEPFPGTSGSPYLKVNDNKILVVWESKFCKSGNPRYAINRCDDPATEEVEADDPLTEENECALYCTGNPEQGTEVCEPDYPYDDDYYVTDIWGVRGQQQSVDYDEVDDVAELGIGEIPYSCLWATRGVIVSQKELDAGTFNSLAVVDDPETPDVDETNIVGLGDIVWFKPERITSGRRDVYIPMVGSARGAGFAIAWQEDPSGLRPGKGKGPGEGWSGAISNHKTDMWYTFISYDDFNLVDANFVPGGPGGGTDAEPTGDEGYLDKPGLGRPKAQVPFALPVRITDNDMVNTHTLKVEPSSQCVTTPDATEQICFPEVVDGSFVPIDPEEIAKDFCGHPEADPATCCDPDNHEGDPNCEDLKGFFGNLNGTKRYAYMASTLDEYGFDAEGKYVYTPGGDGVPDYQYYVDRGGTLDLCDLSGTNSYMDVLPGTAAHERWFGFTNVAGSSKLVCVTSDGRLLDGDVFASRPMLQLQPYTKPDGTKSAWALLAYEESKGLGHSLAAEEHEDTDNPVDEIVGEVTDDSGQEKPIKQDIGKNMMYHSFDFAQPDLVSPGHVVNLPALCGGLYPTYCDDPKTPDVVETDLENPTCTCVPGQPVPLYFDYAVDRDGDPATPDEWLPDPTKFLQYRTEIARRARFLMQSPGKMGETKTLGALIYKQGQEGQGRPADVFIRRFVKSGTGNPYKFENMECTTYLDETFVLPACPNGAGDRPSAVGYNCNVWGEASGDRLCGGVFTDPNGGYPRRDHINLTSHDIDLAVDAGPDDDTPDDPTDDRYGTNKVLLWSQHESNLGNESYGLVHDDGTACDVLGLNGESEACPAMYSNARSHRGFIRGDLLVTAFSMSPNWAAGRNGNDRYNFYVRRSFDGGQTWTTTPADLGGTGVYVCPEFRSDPTNPDPDGGNLPPAVLLDENGEIVCGTYDPTTVPDGELPPMPVGVAMTNYLDPMGTSPDGLPAQFIGAGAFEPARNVSEIKNNHESSGDPRLGTTPPTYPLDGRLGTLPNLCPQGNCVFVEDNYIDNMLFVAWGTVDNAKSTGSTGVKAEAGPLDLFYTRTDNYGDTYLKIPWVIGGVNSNQGYGETVWRYDFIAKGEPEEQGEAQLRATSDGSKAYVIWHSQISAEADPDEVYTRYYPWKPSESSENDLWFRRLIFWPDGMASPAEVATEYTASGDTSTESDEPIDGATFDAGGGAWDGGTVDSIDPIAADPVVPTPTVDVAETQVPAAPVAEPVQPTVLDTPTAELPASTVSAPTSTGPAIPAIAAADAPAAMPPADTVIADSKPAAPARPFVQPTGEREEAVREEGGGEDGTDQSECEIYAVFELTPEGLQMRSIYHHELPGALDPYEPVTEWFEWERAPADTSPDTVWLRQWILCDEEVYEETVTR